MWRATFCWIALIPFLYALLQQDKAGHALSVRQAAALGYVCGIGWYLGNCYWIYQTMYLYGGLPKPVAAIILLLFSLYLGLYHALFAALLALIRRSYPSASAALCASPFLWVAVELARARITGFPWDLLGYTQIDHSLLTRLAPIGGVMALSFVIAVVNAALTAAFVSDSNKRKWISAVTAMTMLLLILAGRMPMSTADQSAPRQTAVLMQENLSVGATGRAVVPLTREQEYQQFSAWSLHPKMLPQPEGHAVRSLSGQDVHPAIIVWPEAPSHFESQDPYFRAQLGSLARRADAPVIAGSLGVDYDNKAPRGYFLYDSASLFDRVGEYSGRYDKIHLVPWGEYVPFKGLFSFTQKLTEGVGDMDRGHERSVFRTDGHTYGVFVCYESIFGNEVRQFAKNGAEVLVNISDDGWYGDTGAPWQHLNMARMRAIENHRWVLRSTNTGITTAIDPWGRIAVEAPRHVRAAFAFRFDYMEGETFYTRHGDWVAWICVGISVILLALSLRPKMN